MKSKLGICFMCIGAAFIIVALSLFVYNNLQDKKAEKSAARLMPKLMDYIAEESDVDSPKEEVNIDGNQYIGYLTVDDLKLNLPVMSDWSYKKLRTAPCRYSGLDITDDLVIMAHNYESHFGKLKNSSIGAVVSFTNINGVTTIYEVVEIEELLPTAVESVASGDFDLTLFTCTYSGKTRLTVRCDRKSK